MDLSQVQAILFDHDGTIVDSESIHFELWKQAIGAFAADFTEQMYAENCVGVPSKGNAEYLLSIFALDMTVEQLMQRKEEVTRQFLQGSYFPLLPFAKDVFDFCQSKGIRMGIVSGSEPFWVARSVEGNQLGAYMESVSTGSEVEHNKPAPDVYQLALSRFDLQPEQCVALEDTEHGLRAAVAANIPCIAIPNEHTVNQDFSSADKVLSSLSEFLTLLQYSHNN